MILVDSCILIDMLEDDARWAGWSQEQLETWSARRPLLINPVTCAPVRGRVGRKLLRTIVAMLNKFGLRCSGNFFSTAGRNMARAI